MNRLTIGLGLATAAGITILASSFLASPTAQSKQPDNHSGPDHKPHTQNMAGSQQQTTSILNDQKPDIPAQSPHHGEGDHKHRQNEKPDNHAGHSDHQADEKGHKEPHKNKSSAMMQNGQTTKTTPAADSHDGHGSETHQEPAGVKLTSAQLEEFAIETSTARGGEVMSYITRPAEIKMNEDRIVHVVPRVEGTVNKVLASEGQVIKEGALMAILDSRELAIAKAEYLAALARFGLAKENYDRDGRLARRKILAERRFQETRTKFIEAQISKRIVTQKLRSLGLSANEIALLPKASDSSLPLYYLKAPLSGVIVERHIVRGEIRSVSQEALTTRKAAFIIADLSKVWVDISIYPSDFKQVSKGQQVRILLEDGGPPVAGRIIFVSPDIQEATRTGFARVLLDNTHRRLHPGVYLKAQISTRRLMAKIKIPKSAVQTSEHGKMVFVKDNGTFVPRPIKLGTHSQDFVEVLAGLKSGETFVSSGAFILKAQLGKAAFGDGHNH